MDIDKTSGLILHPTSLPSDYGIGDFGKESYRFVDLLNESKTKVWQVLPLGITDNIEYSPYSSKSSILGNPYLVSLNMLENDIFASDELDKIKIDNSDEVDYRLVYDNKNNLFKKIAERVNINDSKYRDYIENDLKKQHITFLTLSEVNEGSWNTWSNEYQSYSESLFDEVFNKYMSTFTKNLFLQYEFDNQWQKLKSYANNKNVKILGDIPIYVNHNSADVWLNQHLFDLGDNKEMSFVSGAVPDDFTVEGQVWNTALYKWENHKEEGYKYWIQKLEYSLKNYDYLRIDHFIGFFQFWAIPKGESALNGHWRKGPWKTFFDDVSKSINFEKLLAEDLGVVLKETADILNNFQIPGMKVLQQRIPNESDHDEIHPNKWDFNIAAYTGTHDSPTIKQWINEVDDVQIQFFNQYKESCSNLYESDVWNFISLVWESPCQLAITTIQDLLELGEEARFNLPGTQHNNWKWRIKDLGLLTQPLEVVKELNIKNLRTSA